MLVYTPSAFLYFSYNSFCSGRSESSKSFVAFLLSVTAQERQIGVSVVDSDSHRHG